MTPQHWISPNSTDYGLTPAAAPRPVSAYDLRPLAVGEILDRVLSIYRAHFWLLVGLSAASAGVSVGVAVLRLVFTYFSRITIGSISYTVVTAGFAFVQGGLYLIAYSLTLAATTSAVNSIYLGEPTSIGTALRTARRLWLRCLGVAFWQGWSATWAFCLLGIPVALMLIPGLAGTSTAVLGGIVLFVGMLACLVYGVIAYLRNSLAVPAAVIEDLGVRAAMRRSKNLATGRIGRIFLMLLLVYALSLVAAVIQLPMVFVMARSPATEHYVLQGITLAVTFVSASVVGPVAAIGFCLFYFDERVRREGFDIEILLRGASAPSPPPAYAPHAVADSAAVPQPTPEQI
jgi:ABC-type multidrug transport system fused ATPase/permease subunit